jgi:hypothetical protein
LNNASEIPATDLKAWYKDKEEKEEDALEEPKPIYIPRKVIPLSPAMVQIIWENREHNFSGIINGIRHGQQEAIKNSGAMAKFIRSDYGKVAEISSFRWALDKGNALTEALALHHGNLKFQQTQLEPQGNRDEDYGSTNQGKITMNNNKKGVRFHFDAEGRDILDDTKEFLMVAKDMVATMYNKRADKDDEYIQEDSWAYKAVHLASSHMNEEAATKISPELAAVTKLGDKYARDSIAHNLNQLQKANIRIDKIMATNIRSCRVFRLNSDSTGHMSFFHCYPQKPDDLQDMMSGEELEMKMKLKIVTAKSVLGLFESKLGIAESAEKLKKQAYIFWQYNCFMFGENSYLARKLKELSDVIDKLDNEIDSLAENDEDYILLLAGIINNEYHLFLSSCINANKDIGQVEWDHIDKIPNLIRGFVKARDRPTFVLSTVHRRIKDQTNRDLLMKRRRGENGDDDIAMGGNPNGGGYKNRLKRLKRNENADDQEREIDPEKTNDNVRKEWKMPANEFQRVCGEYTESFPKLGNKSICVMYNIVGRCYFGANCKHTHADLPDDVVAEIDDWINNCKKKGKDSPKK